MKVANTRRKKAIWKNNNRRLKITRFYVGVNRWNGARKQERGDLSLKTNNNNAPSSASTCAYAEGRATAHWMYEWSNAECGRGWGQGAAVFAGGRGWGMERERWNATGAVRVLRTATLPRAATALATPNLRSPCHQCRPVHPPRPLPVPGTTGTH